MNIVEQKKLVSVIIPTYRRPINLERAINSVLKQSYPNIEIIVIDDNNEDSEYRKETESLINKSYKDKVIYIKHEKNRNGSAARNTGISNSNGYYISFLDDDDEFMREKIEKQVEALESAPKDYGICYTDFTRKHKENVVGKSKDNKSGKITVDLLLGRLHLSSGSNLLLKKEIIDEIKGFNEEYVRRQDIEFLARASQISKVLHVNYNGLIIHKDDRSNVENYSNSHHEENTQMFIEEFSPYLDSINEELTTKFLQSQQLINIRTLISKRKFREAKLVQKKYNLPTLLIVNFFAYSLKRKITGEIYGFKI